jgi:hypothetical protein
MYAVANKASRARAPASTQQRGHSPYPQPRSRVPTVACVTDSNATQTTICYGIHPDTGARCILGEHVGYHEAAEGTRWLDD